MAECIVAGVIMWVVLHIKDAEGAQAKVHGPAED